MRIINHFVAVPPCVLVLFIRVLIAVSFTCGDIAL